jgi:Polysaccharide lyase family 4, domain II
MSRSLCASMLCGFVASVLVIAQSTRDGASTGLADTNKPAALDGMVISAVDERAVAKVYVSLRSAEAPFAAKYTASSDVQGRFQFAEVLPGTYTLYAERRGFIGQAFGARRIAGKGAVLTIEPGSRTKDLVFKLVPQSVLTGKLTDEDGDPMENVSVVMLQWMYGRGKRSLRPIGGATLTDDRGEYRLSNVSPGQYYLAAHRGRSVAGMQMRSAGTPSDALKPEKDYHTMYYPGVLEYSAALPITVKPAADLRDISIQFRKTRVFSVHGQVVDEATGRMIPGTVVALVPAKVDSVVSVSGLGSTRLGDGRFEITGVIPGSYHIMAQVTQSGHISYSRQPVDVIGDDVSGVVVRIPRSIELRGQVRIAEEDRQAAKDAAVLEFSKLRISLVPVDGIMVGNVAKAEVARDGSFVIASVTPDKLRVSVSGLPSGWYVQAFVIDGRQHRDGVIDLKGQGGPVELVMSSRCSEITGSVVDEGNGKSGSGIEVTLIPEDAEKQGQFELFRMTSTDKTGAFHLENIVPGIYKMFAWEELVPGAGESVEFHRRFDNKAVTVNLDEKRQERIQLTVIPAEEVLRVTNTVEN